jgi:hypothetical protein
MAMEILGEGSLGTTITSSASGAATLHATRNCFIAAKASGITKRIVHTYNSKCCDIERIHTEWQAKYMFYSVHTKAGPDIQAQLKGEQVGHSLGAPAEASSETD